MAKDGTQRGGPRLGAGVKAKADPALGMPDFTADLVLPEPVLESVEKVPILPFLLALTPDSPEGKAMPKVEEYMKEPQKDGSVLMAEKVFTNTRMKASPSMAIQAHGGEAKITVNGSTLSSLTYMTVDSDRITFENTAGSITFFTTGDTAAELKSAYSALSAYIVLMASTLGVETADIRPKANNTYSIGANGNVYARGYFNTLDATTINVSTVNGTTVKGAVFN